MDNDKDKQDFNKSGNFNIGENDLFPKFNIPSGNEIGPRFGGFNIQQQQGTKGIKEIPPGGFNFGNIEDDIKKPEMDQ